VPREKIREAALVGVVHVAPDDERIGEPVAARLGDAAGRVHHQEHDLEEAHTTAHDLGRRRAPALLGQALLGAARAPGIDAVARAGWREEQRDDQRGAELVDGEGLDAVLERDVGEQEPEHATRNAGERAQRGGESRDDNERADRPRLPRLERREVERLAPVGVTEIGHLVAADRKPVIGMRDAR